MCVLCFQEVEWLSAITDMICTLCKACSMFLCYVCCCLGAATHGERTEYRSRFVKVFISHLYCCGATAHCWMEEAHLRFEKLFVLQCCCYAIAHCMVILEKAFVLKLHGNWYEQFVIDFNVIFAVDEV